MKSSIIFAVIVCILALSIFQCNDKPDVNISLNNNTSVVWGTAVPETLSTHVYLLKNGDTITSTVTNSKGNFVFTDLPFGIYTIKGSCGDWYAETTLDAYEPRVSANLQMFRGGGYLYYTSITPGGKITPAHIEDDSMLSFNILINRAAFIGPGLDIQPKRLSDDFIIDTSKGYNTRIVIFRIDSLFSVDTLKIAIRIKHSENGSLFLTDSIFLTYPIDSTGLDSVLSDNLVRRTGSGVFSSDGRIHANHNVVSHNLEEEILIDFFNPMNRQSVEKSITTQPQFAATFFWSDNLLRIVPSNSLLPDTIYTITIGTQAMTMDSVFFRCPLTFTVTTLGKNFFYSYWPLNSAMYIDPILPFVFYSNYSVDPHLLRNAFSITPSVDSLRFEMIEPGTVKVYHAALLPGTKYQIVLDSSLTSLRGTLLGKDLNTSFTTITKQ